MCPADPCRAAFRVTRHYTRDRRGGGGDGTAQGAWYLGHLYPERRDGAAVLVSEGLESRENINEHNLLLDEGAVRQPYDGIDNQTSTVNGSQPQVDGTQSSRPHRMGKCSVWK